MKRFINSRYKILMVSMLMTILSYIPGVCISGGTVPTPTSTPTPEPTPTACCREGYHQEPTYADIKVGALGVMTDVEISGPTCVQWNYPQTATYYASGGNDRDVCVKDDGLGAYEYDVDEDFIWGENGDITGEEQDMNIIWNGLFNVRVFATHTFEVPNGVSFTSEMAVSGGSSEQEYIELSSYDTHSFAYDYYTSMGGLKSEFYAFIVLDMGGVGGNGYDTLSLSLSAPKCCDD
jgi:hypothetical protein